MTSCPQFNFDQAVAVSKLIGNQSDLLWTSSVALIVTATYIGCRYFADQKNRFQWWYTGFFWILSMIFFLLSLLCGYLTRGALIVMIEKASQKQNTYEYYSNSEVSALIQFSLLLLGLVFFILTFTTDFKRMAKALDNSK